MKIILYMIPFFGLIYAERKNSNILKKLWYITWQVCSVGLITMILILIIKKLKYG
jgi:hypothetical protein